MKKQLIMLAVAICLFAAAEMQGLPADPAATVYVSGPQRHEILATQWDSTCQPVPYASGALVTTVYSNGSQFRPTGIEVGGDGYVYFADDSHSEVGRVAFDGSGFEIISDSSISTLENPTDVIFAGNDLIISSRAGSKKSDSGLFRSTRGTDGSFPIPEPFISFGSGGGSSAEALGMLFERTLIATESSDAEVLSYPFPYDQGIAGPATPVFDRPLGIAAYGVGRSEFVYVAFSTTGQIKRFKSAYNLSATEGGDDDPETFDGLVEDLDWPALTLPDGYKPRHLDTDLSGNLYAAASQRSNSGDGTLFCIPNDYVENQVATIGSIQLDSAWGVAVGAGSSVTKDLVAGEGLKLCGDEIRLNDGITAKLTCTDITPAEFDDFVNRVVDEQTHTDGFPNAQCLLEPGKNSCTLIEVNITGVPSGFTGDIELARIFVPFLDFNLGPDGIYGTADDPEDVVKDPGVLYADDLGTDTFSENILTFLEDALIDEIDPPRMTGSRDNFGSFVLYCEDCNGWPQFDPYPLQDVTADAGTNGTADVTVDMTITDLGPVTYKWELLDGPDGDPVAGQGPLEEGTAGNGEETLDYNFGIGEHYVRLTATDSGATPRTSSADVMITVRDPFFPTVTGVTATPDNLWPPNHDFHEISLAVQLTDQTGSNDTHQCKIFVDIATDPALTGITHDDAINGQGDGDTDPDWMIQNAGVFQGGPLKVLMRSERAENDPVLPDRTYSVMVQCRDASGNLSPVSPWIPVVTVDDNQGRN